MPRVLLAVGMSTFSFLESLLPACFAAVHVVSSFRVKFVEALLGVAEVAVDGCFELPRSATSIRNLSVFLPARDAPCAVHQF